MIIMDEGIRRLIPHNGPFWGWWRAGGPLRRGIRHLIPGSDAPQLGRQDEGQLVAAAGYRVATDAASLGQLGHRG